MAVPSARQRVPERETEEVKVKVQGRPEFTFTKKGQTGRADLAFQMGPPLFEKADYFEYPVDDDVVVAW